jgi:predicted dehydrogenase
MSTKVGIIGGGWPGLAHAKGYREAGGFTIVAVADLIPDRREKLAVDSPKARQFTDAMEVVKDPEVEAVSICLPTAMHVPIALAALKAGKHVMLETPPGRSVRDSKQLETAAAKRGKILSYAFQRRFGGAEMASQQAIEKGYAGEAIHARSTLMRTRGIPVGTGWYSDKSQSGGGALLDLGIHMLDLGWALLGHPRPVSAFAVTYQKFQGLAANVETEAVEDSAFALLKFEGGKSLELAVSWAINQPPAQNGTTCRVHGSMGAIEVYTPTGPVLYRSSEARSGSKPTELKQPKVVGHTAMLRQFRESILGKATPTVGASQGVLLMQMMEGLYRSAQTSKSAAI